MHSRPKSPNSGSWWLPNLLMRCRDRLWPELVRHFGHRSDIRYPATKWPLASRWQLHRLQDAMISVLQRIVVLVLAVAFAMSSAGGSMAGMRMGGYDHSAEKSLLAAHTTDGHTHIRKSEIITVDDLDSERSAGASDHCHDGVESSCCVMCHFAVEMPFPNFVHTCPASVIEPQGQHPVRQRLIASLERPPRAGFAHTG
jgi:hypothetical protein